jgi:hypothetical protein
VFPAVDFTLLNRLTRRVVVEFTERLTFVVACLACVLGLTGCIGNPETAPDVMVEAEVTLDFADKTLTVVPFSYGQMGFYDWTYGTSIGRRTEAILREKMPQTTVTHPHTLEAQLGGVRFEEFSPLELIGRTNVDYIVAGGFSEFSAGDPLNINWNEGNACLTLEVYDMNSGGATVFYKVMDVRYPPLKAGRADGVAYSTERAVLQMLADECANRIASLFYSELVPRIDLYDRPL